MSLTAQALFDMFTITNNKARHAVTPCHVRRTSISSSNGEREADYFTSLATGRWPRRRGGDSRLDLNGGLPLRSLPEFSGDGNRY